ncbi:MAG TPA: hypothetical protein VGD71_04040 [Kribbella sp.]
MYGEEYGSLVFLDEPRAQAWTAELEAISRVSTFGEARALAVHGMWLPGIYDEDDVEEHPDAEPYDPSDFDDWPGRAATLALDSWPEDLGDIGEQIDHRASVSYLYIDPAEEATVVATLRERGYIVRRDDSLFERMQTAIR